MTHKLDIPFIKSRGWECGQTCVAMMIQYYYPDFHPDFDEMNRVIHHKKGMYTFPPQLSLLLDHYGVASHVYSSDDILTSQEDPDQFKRWFQEDYDSQLKYIDIPSVDWMATEIKSKNLFVRKESTFSELLAECVRGNLVGMPIDWNRATGKAGPYHGHFVIIAGIEDNDLYIHDPDVGPFQKYPASIIKMAWEHPAIADDYLVAAEKKT